MLENFIWKNLLLPSFIKREIVSFYEKNTQNPFLFNKNISIKKSLVYYLCNSIHKKWFIDSNKSFFIKNKIHLIEDIREYIDNKALPMSFWLFLAKTNKVEKLRKLFEWGFNINKTFEVKGVETNLLHQVIWAYNKNLLTLDECKDIFSELIKNNINIFPYEYKISHYEKALALSKENKNNNENILIKKKKLVDLVYSWIDKDLYQYFITSELNDDDKKILEYLLLKNKIHTIYVEQYSGNLRKVGQENIYKSINVIESIIRRDYIFNSQSDIYNTLSLIFNLPNVSELLSINSLSNCYKRYDELGNSAKKYLLSSLLGKQNKDVIIFNLLKYSNLNWKIPTENGRKCLGITLFKENVFMEHIMNDECFNVLNTTIKGENILHLVGNEINNKDIARKINIHLDYLSQQELTYLLGQRDNNQLTPMLRAIKEENKSLINFLLELNDDVIKEENGIEGYLSSPLNYLESTIGNDDDSYWYYLLKSWKIEKSYLLLNKKIKDKKTSEIKKKTIKI